MKRGSWFGAVVLTLLLAMSVTGCKDKTTKPPVDLGDGYLPQSSPANVIANLKQAYESRQIDKYVRLFSSDFVFVFNPLDVIDPVDPTPTSWALDEERTSTENMFADSQVRSIDVDLVTSPVEPADSVAYPGSTWRMKVDDARLSVNTRTQDGEPLTYLVPGTREVFYFREDPSRLATDGRPSYFIFRWEDQPIHGIKTETNTWGQIKSMFRKPRSV